ncbi:MAG: hybrid sensor histidine kinase/response regulator [Promethearchaeota archaeon]
MNIDDQICHSILKNPNIGIIKLDKNFNIIYVNSKFCVLIGYKENELLGHSPTKFLLDEYKIDISSKKKAISENKQTYPFERGWKTKSGSIRYTLNSGKPVFAKDGSFNSVIIILVDITRQKLNEKKIKEEQNRLQKFQSIGLLAGGLAHDFNNILVGILGNIQLLEMSGNLDADQMEILSNLNNSTLKAAELTKKLLTFSKGGKPIKKSEDIINIVDEVAKASLKTSNINYQCSVEDVITTIKIDKDQMKQALSALLINAKESMLNGGIIYISISTVEIKDQKSIPLSSGKYVRIAIKDSGIGISKKYHDKIFDLFFSTKTEGKGLGLPISLSIVQNHGGYINFTSKEGEGSIFYVYLPFEKEKKEKENISKITQTKAKSVKCSVLLMDDNEDIHILVKRVFKKFKISMDSAYDGLETIEKYKKSLASGNPYSLIIMDLIIPGGLGGKETMKKLLEIDPNVKVIVSSGYSYDPILSNYEDYGFIDVLQKPFAIKSLKDMLTKYTGCNLS